MNTFSAQPGSHQEPEKEDVAVESIPQQLRRGVGLMEEYFRDTRQSDRDVTVIVRGSKVVRVDVVNMDPDEEAAEEGEDNA